MSFWSCCGVTGLRSMRNTCGRDLSPVKTGSRDPRDLNAPGSKPGATVLTAATPPVQVVSIIGSAKCRKRRTSPDGTTSGSLLPPLPQCARDLTEQFDHPLVLRLGAALE